VQRYYEGGDKLWKVVIDAKYSVNSPNLFCCHERNSPPLQKGSCGLHRLLGWAIGGKWVMGKEFGSGRISGLVLAPWQFSSGNFM
jgi:hypothetical protein